MTAAHPIRTAPVQVVALVAVAVLTATPSVTVCAQERPVEAISLTGDSLRRYVQDDETRRTNAANLASARRAYRNSPDNADSIIWFGRRTAYTGAYRDAIEIFSEGIAKHPDDPRMYRHRGHRFITLRQFDSAIADFERAAALFAGQPDVIEPDGLPNAMNIPTSTLQGNVWYHLGLAHYLKGDFTLAAESYERGMALNLTPDMHIAFAHWLYMAYRRLGRHADADRVLATVTTDMEIIENDVYYRLLMMYKGLSTVESLVGAEYDPLDGATTLYGVGNWYLYNGNAERARSAFETVLTLPQWAAFGYIAAEAELARRLP